MKNVSYVNIKNHKNDPPTLLELRALPKIQVIL